jgi:nitrogen fixation NifU-like protein
MDHHHHTHEIPDRESFLRHVRRPLHLGMVANPQGRATGIGSCGDAVELSLRIENDTIMEIAHQPNGCDYTIACASALCTLARGKTMDDALALEPEDVALELGGLPEDHFHCARLAVNTLGEAIADACKAMAASYRKEA